MKRLLASGLMPVFLAENIRGNICYERKKIGTSSNNGPLLEVIRSSGVRRQHELEI